MHELTLRLAHKGLPKVIVLDFSWRNEEMDRERAAVLGDILNCLRAADRVQLILPDLTPSDAAKQAAQIASRVRMALQAMALEHEIFVVEQPCAIDGKNFRLDLTRSVVAYV